MTITVRKYTPADAAAAAEIWNEVVPGGFRLDDGTYADICLYYKTLD